MRRKRAPIDFDPFNPPPYPTSKVFLPDDGELESIGAASISVMVADVNRAWKQLNRHPITQYDYPTNRAKFNKLVGWWKDAKA